MRRAFAVGLLALAGFALASSPARADVLVRAPFVRLAVAPVYPCGPVVAVRVPCLLRVHVLRPVVVVQPVTPPPPVVVTPGVPVMPPAVEPPAAVQAPPMTHQEFAGRFQPAAGSYDVVLLHPFTKCPVT